MTPHLPTLLTRWSLVLSYFMVTFGESFISIEQINNLKLITPSGPKSTKL